MAVNRTRCIILLAGACVVAASPASAHVLEFGAEGEVRVYARPATFTQAGVEEIRPLERLTLKAPRPTADLARAVRAASEATRLAPELIEAVAWVESRFNQLMPGTATELGVDAYNLAANVLGGAVYLERMLHEFDNDLEAALAAYNAGPAAVRRFGGAPPFKETQYHVQAVLDYLAVRAQEEAER